MGGAHHGGGWLKTVLGIASCLALLGCNGGGDDGTAGPAGPVGPPGPAGPPGGPGSGSVVIGPLDPLPGVVATVVGVTDSTGGNLAVGDFVTVRFTAKNDAGDALDVTQLGGGQIYLSGPSNNYQLVLLPKNDVATRSVNEGGGVWAYTFVAPIPATYPAPLNNTDDFGLADGELQGTPLVDGTYTVGLQLYWLYDVDGVALRDAGAVVKDVLFGTATTISHREVVGNANCNACHNELRAHGGTRVDVQLCVLCHTSGSEDGSSTVTPSLTRFTSIDFKVMIHKLHNGAHLPSVNGVGVNDDGSRNYAATPTPYVVIGRGTPGSINDFSSFLFPVYPNFTSGMPQDAGYAALLPAQKTQENAILRGATACVKCHGDPDGSGTAPAPAQGALYRTQPSRQVCGSCHDDINWTKPYVSNSGSGMPGNLSNGSCVICHAASGDVLAIDDAHLHPLLNPTLATGVKILVTAVDGVTGPVSANPTPNNTKLEVGERVRITFSVVNNAGTAIPASGLYRLEAVLSGPTTNPQAINYQRLTPAYFSGNGPYTVNMPDQVFYEPVGISTILPGQTFTTSLAPHWNVNGLSTTLLRRTAKLPGTTLAAAAPVAQNWLDVVDGTLFANGDTIVIDDLSLTNREYMKIQLVEGNRLWFSSRFRTTHKPNVLKPHAVGATVEEVTVEVIPAASWTLDAATGAITEAVEFGDGEILASYTSDFVIPPVYPGALYDTPVNGQDWADWTGLAMLDGTYTFDLHGARQFSTTFPASGTSTSYTEGSVPTDEATALLPADVASASVKRLLFGGATTKVQPNRVVGAAACYKCHDSIAGHGGSRRGYETCIQCHGGSGAELEAVYDGGVNGISVEFRSALHLWHKEALPSMPGGSSNCVVCHGSTFTAYYNPPDRVHPDETAFAKVWTVPCASCHDTPLATAHIAAQTGANGVETCTLCHGPGKPADVRAVHFPR